jgi:hypothetical protein
LERAFKTIEANGFRKSSVRLISKIISKIISKSIRLWLILLDNEKYGVSRVHDAGLIGAVIKCCKKGC